MLNEVANIHGKNRYQLVTEMNENACGGGYTYLNECPLSEIQMLCKEVAVDKNLNKNVTTVKHPMIYAQSAQLHLV